MLGLWGVEVNVSGTTTGTFTTFISGMGVQLLHHRELIKHAPSKRRKRKGPLQPAANMSAGKCPNGMSELGNFSPQERTILP